MSQDTTDDLILSSLFFTVIGSLIPLIIELKNQEKKHKKSTFEERTKNEISRLEQEINQLKKQIVSPILIKNEKS